jgi:hypothetical protein
MVDLMNISSAQKYLGTIRQANLALHAYMNMELVD